MNTAEQIWAASVAIGKRMDYEQLKYSDYMYGNEDKTEDVWEYIEECEKIGREAFKEKYKTYKIYAI